MTQPTGIECDPQQMADLTTCDQEPIHTPGAIQPWGALLVAGRHDLTVTHCSTNVAEWLGLSPGAVLGHSLDRVLGDEGSRIIRGTLAEERFGFSNVRPVSLPSAPFPLQMAAHLMNDSIFIEIEAATPDAEQGAILRNALTVMRSLHAASSQHELCAIVVAQLRQLTGYDRVMVYRFDREGHGEVVAEARDRDLEPYLGLRYPASDIPRQARRMYLAQRVRSIADVDYKPVPVLADPTLGAHLPLDMTLCGLRSVSPIHLEYMRNMGTQASLGVSLILNNALWGMLVFHHRSPLAVTAELRSQCDLIGQLVSLLLGSLGEAESYAEQLGRQRTFHEIVGRLSSAGPVMAALQASSDALLTLLQAGGAVIRLGEHTLTLGVTPPAEAVQHALLALSGTSKGAVVAVDELQEILPDWSVHSGVASGALLLPLPPNAADVIIWFRPEMERVINWAGNPSKPAVARTTGGRLSPRHSFAAWQELVRGHSEPWQHADRALAHELQRVVIMALARQTEAELANLRYYDALTGLPNRRMFEEKLDAQGVGPNTALLYLDLDHFKAVNDTLGHPAGDALLRAVAERLSGCTRKEDLIVRLGGDEFVIVQAGGEQPFRAVALAQRVVNALGQPFELNGQQVSIGVSIGIAVGQIGAVPDGLLRDADVAMYQAKAAGRSNFHLFRPGTQKGTQTPATPEGNVPLVRDPHHPGATAFPLVVERAQPTPTAEDAGTVGQAFADRQQLERDLRDVCAACGFELEYQPQVDLQALRVTNFEALLRWRHPVRGNVAPAEFIPLAEELGLIGEIDRWVLKRACQEAMDWPDDVGVAVNISAAQLMDVAFPSVVAAALIASRLAPSRLELEVTETKVLPNDPITLAVLHEIRKSGVGIVMDDFDVGYSALGYLVDFPFTKIKIDQTFTDKLPQDNLRHEAAITIVRSIIGLCADLKIACLAEGVEAEEQLATLEKIGCTDVQGYLLGRPVPFADTRATVESMPTTLRRMNYPRKRYGGGTATAGDVPLHVETFLAALPPLSR